jgi:GNAT superfamily N-acetyltransferase
MILRCEARPEHLPARVREDVLKLDKTLFGEDVAVEPEGGWWWLIRDHRGKGIAFAGLRPCHHESNKGLCFMIRSGVLTKHRGQGMQKRLIRARIAMAKRHGFKQIVTYVLDWNLASANSLIACGFRLYIPESKYAGSKAFYFQKMLVGKQ